MLEITLSPDQLRITAHALGDYENALPSYVATAAKLRDIADRLENGDTCIENQPAYRVVYRLPPE